MKIKLIDNDYSYYNKGYKSMYEIYVHGKPYTECEEYHLKKELIVSGLDNGRGFRNMKDLNDYYLFLDKIYTDMKANGYKTQQELGNYTEDEIGVFISTSGDVIKAEDNMGGSHRFAMARILGIKYIPVIIEGIHNSVFSEYSKNYISNPRSIVKKFIEKLED